MDIKIRLNDTLVVNGKQYKGSYDYCEDEYTSCFFSIPVDKEPTEEQLDKIEDECREAMRNKRFIVNNDIIHSTVDSVEYNDTYNCVDINWVEF